MQADFIFTHKYLQLGKFVSKKKTNQSRKSRKMSDLYFLEVEQNITKIKCFREWEARDVTL